MTRACGVQAPEYDAEGNVVDPEAGETTGSGLVLLSTRQGRLMMALVPDVADADAEAELEPCTIQFELELLPDERVLQVICANAFCAFVLLRLEDLWTITLERARARNPG